MTKIVKSGGGQRIPVGQKSGVLIEPPPTVIVTVEYDDQTYDVPLELFHKQSIDVKGMPIDLELTAIVKQRPVPPEGPPYRWRMVGYTQNYWVMFDYDQWQYSGFTPLVNVIKSLDEENATRLFGRDVGETLIITEIEIEGR